MNARKSKWCVSAMRGNYTKCEAQGEIHTQKETLTLHTHTKYTHPPFFQKDTRAADECVLVPNTHGSSNTREVKLTRKLTGANRIMHIHTHTPLIQ